MLPMCLQTACKSRDIFYILICVLNVYTSISTSEIFISIQSLRSPNEHVTVQVFRFAQFMSSLEYWTIKDFNENFLIFHVQERLFYLLLWIVS